MIIDKHTAARSVAVLGLCVLPLGACDDDEPVENAVEETDDALDEAGDAVEDAVDDAADAVEDAGDDVGGG